MLKEDAMTVEGRMARIDNKVQSDKEKEIALAKERERRMEDCKSKIKELKPRIDDLIKLCNYAKANGIELSKRGWGGHEGYDTGMFYSNGWSHLVGFIPGDPVCYLGIVAGGACGYIDFITNGEDISGIEEGTRKVVEPLLNHMEHFLNEFDYFEEEFYKRIDKLCS